MTTSMTHAEIQALFSGERREQRRYEIAKGLFTQDVSTESDLEYAKTVAARAAQFADALLAELERTK